MKTSFIFILLLLVLAGCTISVNPSENTANPDDNLQMSNPSATFCIHNGYVYEIRTNPDGSQGGFCVFYDGTECDGWDYFYGTCNPNQSASTIPVTNIAPIQTSSSKEQLISLISGLYEDNEANYHNGPYTDGITLTFTTSDSLTNDEIARSLGAYYGDITISCSNSVPTNMPPESLGCVQYDGITPTSDTEAYVYVTCAGSSRTVCVVDFAKV